MLYLRNQPPNLARYLPQFLQEDEHFKATLAACSTEHEKYRLLLDEITNQFYVETATWGLSDWERIVDIAPKPSDTYDERRRRVLLKLQSHQTSTLAFMEQLISRYLDAGRGYIEEHPERYAFRVMLEGCLIDKPGLIEALETYKPAHLGYDFRFLLIGDTLREDFAATQYGDDNAITDLVARLRYHLEDAYLYESFDDPPRHGDEGLYHDGLHMRVGADGPTIDRVSVGLVTSFVENLQTLGGVRGDGLWRGCSIRHGPSVYPFDLGTTVQLSAQLEDTTTASTELSFSLSSKLEDWCPYGLKTARIPVHGQDGERGRQQRGGASDVFRVEESHLTLSTYFEDDLQSISFPRGDGIERGTELLHGKNVYPHDSGLAISVRYQGARGYLCRDGVLARGSTLYHGDHAETILDSRRRHGDTFPRGTGFIRGGA